MTYLDKSVTFRLSPEKHEAYLAQANQCGLSLSAYLRFRLEQEDAVSEQFKQLRLMLVEPDHTAGPPTGSDSPMILELLLLMRRLVAPDDLRSVHLEMQRLGMPAWRPGATAPDNP